MKNTLTRYDSDDFFNGNWLKSFFDLPIVNNSNILKTNIKKEGDNYIYEIDVAGFDKEDVSISYDSGYLIVETRKNKSSNEEYSTSGYIRQERYTGSCSRSYYIGEVEQSKISAKYNNGILCVSVPIEDKEKKHKSRIINID